MTTLQTPAPTQDAPPIPFSTLVRVEMRKAYDTRSGMWLLIVTAGLVVFFEFIAALVGGFHYRDWQGPVSPINPPPELLNVGTFSTVAGVITQVLIPVIAIMTVTSEWTQRTAMVTFALEPRRSLVIWAKMVVAFVLGLATTLVAVVMGFVFNALYVSIAGASDWSFPWKGLLAFIIVQLLTMFSCFAFGAIFLNTPAAIVFTIAAHFVLPGIISYGESLMSWFNSFGPWIDFQGSLTKMYDWGYTGKDWGELITSGLIWFVAPLVIGLRRIMTAEVK